MAVLEYLGEQVIASLRQMHPLPNNLATGSTDAEVLKAVNEAMRLVIIPRTMKTKEEYFVHSVRLPLVEGQSRYRIPHRAMYQKIRRLFLVDGSGNRWKLTRKHSEDLDESTTIGRVGNYYFEGNDIVLFDGTTSGYSFLEVSYFFRPGDLQLSTAARKVLTVNTGTKAVTFSAAIPSTWSTSTVFDVHSGQSGAEIKQYDIVGSVVAGSGITFTTAIDGSVFGTKKIEIGDWVCVAEEAALPGLPRELHPIIARTTALHFAESLGDQAMVNIHAELLKAALADGLGAMETRNESQPEIITGKRGILWAGRRW